MASVSGVPYSGLKMLVLHCCKLRCLIRIGVGMLCDTSPRSSQAAKPA